jgi:hypothetical protein
MKANKTNIRKVLCGLVILAALHCAVALHSMLLFLAFVFDYQLYTQDLFGNSTQQGLRGGWHGLHPRRPSWGLARPRNQILGWGGGCGWPKMGGRGHTWQLGGALPSVGMQKKQKKFQPYRWFVDVAPTMPTDNPYRWSPCVVGLLASSVPL